MSADGGPPFIDPMPGQPVMTTRRWRMPVWAKVLIVFGVMGVLTFGGVVGTCLYVGALTPDTRVLPGRQVPARFVSQIRKLNLLEPGENIEYFYSDALVNIEEGMYFLTDRKLVVYSRELEAPAIRVPFAEIAHVDASFSDEWMTDSMVTITLTDGQDVSFPLSCEGSGDRKMVDAMRRKMEARTSE